MPRKIIDYSKTIIYKLVCKDVNITDCYVGSTTDFIRRRSEHKNCTVNNTSKSYLYVYEFINKNGGWDNWDMIEVEKYNASDKLDSLKKERYWLEDLKATLNKRIPSRPKEEYKKEWYKANPEYNKEYHKEYQEINKQKISEQNKEYYENNKDKMKEYQKEWYEGNKEQISKLRTEKITCECGCIVSKTHIARHKKSNLHFLNQQ